MSPIWKSLLQMMLAFQFCGLIESTALSNTLQRLNAAYGTELNIFINMPREQLSVELQEMPRIELLLSSNSSHNLSVLGRFTEKTLVVFYIRSYPLDAQALTFLPRLLWQLHELPFVLVTPEDPSTWEEDLYRNCFEDGLINVLLIQQVNATLLFHSYNPYPTIRPLRLPRLEAFLDRWRQLRNLQSLPIRTIAFSIEPRLFHYVNRKGQLVYAGYMFNIMREFGRRHNATIQIVKEVEKKYLYETTMEMFDRKEMDFVCYPKDLSFNMASTAPVHLLRFNIAVPYARPIATNLYFARPFTWTLWLAVIGTIGYGMVMLCGSDRGNRGSRGDGGGCCEIGKHFLSCWSHLLFIPQPTISLANWQHVTIHFLLMLCGFILTNFYLALLSSMLTSGLFEPQLNTLQDLVHAPYSLLLDDYYAQYLVNSDFLPDAVRQRIQIVEAHLLDKTRISLNVSYMYIGYDDRIDGILYQQHLLRVPRFKLISQSFLDGYMSFPVKDGLPYLSMLNCFMRRIFEGGILAKLRSAAWRDATDAGIIKLIRTDAIHQKAHDLKFYLYVFGLWAVGLAMGSLCFLLELLRARMTHRIQL